MLWLMMKRPVRVYAVVRDGSLLDEWSSLPESKWGLAKECSKCGVGRVVVMTPAPFVAPLWYTCSLAMRSLVLFTQLPGRDGNLAKYIIHVVRLLRASECPHWQDSFIQTSVTATIRLVQGHYHTKNNVIKTLQWLF